MGAADPANKSLEELWSWGRTDQRGLVNHTRRLERLATNASSRRGLSSVRVASQAGKQGAHAVTFPITLMPEPSLLPFNQVVRIVAQRDKLAFALFLGAGASKSSGVPLASEMIAEWRDTAWREQAPTGIEFQAWCAQQAAWFQQEDEYSRLFELLYLDPPSRQKFIESKIQDAFPSWGYLYLANMMSSGRFNVVFTTNFDDLINDALTIFLGYNPVMCAADSEVSTINATSERAKIIKLHGDYLFQSIRNTVEELQRLGVNMEQKFCEFATQCGLVQIGYAGRDQSVMGVLEQLLKQERTFPHGVYWGVRPGSDIPERVQRLAQKHPKRFNLFACPDFDLFMARLHDALKGENNQALPLPATILRPYDALQQRYQRLLDSMAGPIAQDPTVQAHVQTLSQELGRVWAKAKAEDFDLLEAQMALGRRDYRTALEVIARFMAQRPNSAEGLSAWGYALAIRSEEEASDSLMNDAAAKWKQAIMVDPTALPPRYGLARYYARQHNIVDGIAACEELLKLVPNDVGLRRSLAQLYGTASRFDEAERELAWLLRRDPKNPDFYAFQAGLYEQRGMVLESVNAARAAVALAPSNAWLHFSLATILAKTARLNEAAAEYEEATRLEPRNVNFRLQSANFYCMGRQPALALTHLKAAAATAPQSAEVHGWMCQALAMLGEFPAAQLEGEQAVRLSPRDSRIRNTVATVHLQARRPDLAEPHFEAAIESNPNLPDSYANLCFLYGQQGRMQEFEGVLQRLSRVNPQAAQGLRIQLLGGLMPGTNPNWSGSAPVQSPAAPSPPPLLSPSPPGQTSQRTAPKWQQFFRGL